MCFYKTSIMDSLSIVLVCNSDFYVHGNCGAHKVLPRYAMYILQHSVCSYSPGPELLFCGIYIHLTII